MTAPVLIDINVAKRLPRELFCDLHLDRILSDNALCTLSHPCDKGEILRRQGIFAFFEKNSNILTDCIDELKRHQKLIRMLKEARTELERLRLRSALLRQYATVRQSLFRLSGCETLRNFGEFFSMGEAQKDLLYAADEADKLLDCLSCGIISFRDKCRIVKRGKTEDEYERIHRCADALGLTVWERKRQRTKITPSISNGILELFPEEYRRIQALLDSFSATDTAEILKYVSQLEFISEMISLKEKAVQKGLNCCVPQISDKRQYAAMGIYDIALLLIKGETPVGNDADFSEMEKMFFLAGTNGGGKTTFLRAIASNLIFFLGGCAVFGERASIFPFDAVMTHFPADERFELSGRLDDEKRRTEDLLCSAEEKNAFLFLNETYSGTDDKRGFELLKQLTQSVRAKGHFCLYVTHFYRVRELDVPLLVPTTDYRIERSVNGAESHARDILKKYELDRLSLEKRRKENANKYSWGTDK